MSLTDKTKDCCGLNLYNVAKYTTLIEICCTGNVTHLIELYGLFTKKAWAISIGYFWRMFIGKNHSWPYIKLGFLPGGSLSGIFRGVVGGCSRVF